MVRRMNLLNEDQFVILERLKTNGPLSVDAITEWKKQPKTAIRRALLSLEKRGLIVRSLIKNKRGRPTLSFSLAPQSKQVFPSKEAEVLSELIKYMLKGGQRSVLESFFTAYWDQRYTRVMEKISEKKCRDLSARIEALKEVLNEDGFYARARLSKNKDQVTLRECHCPISAVAESVDIPCRLEARLISRVLNANCISAEPMNSKRNNCLFKFQK
jgi:predicted ArsR family transcriptional regulator